MSAVDRAAAALIMIITLMKVVAQYTGPGLMRNKEPVAGAAPVNYCASFFFAAVIARRTCSGAVPPM